MTQQGDWLAHTWRRRGPIAYALLPLAWLYGALAQCHRWLYRFGVLSAHRCRVPVIVVGNVMAGGAGKTPTVIALAKHLQQQGLQVGVVSRGYRRHSQACVEVLNVTPISESGDEPALIFNALSAPVFVASKRSDAIASLLAKHPQTQVIVSDDGLQHRSMARDIEVLVFNDSGIGNGWLLPAGPLREEYQPGRTSSGPVPRLVLHTGQVPAFAGFVSTRCLAACAVAAGGQLIPLDDLRHQPVTALAGIANPNAFFDMLRARGLQLAHTAGLPDHFDFANYNLPLHHSNVVLCTEKDAVKLFKRPVQAGVQLMAVPLVFAPEHAFLAAVDVLLTPLLHKPT